MAISFSRPDPASAASVSSAQFPTTRRGFDQNEVRDFLRMVAAEMARLQERERFLERELRSSQQLSATPSAPLDEETATRLLGEEAARVLATAREAAGQIRARAEEGSARLLREATDEAQRLREEAEVEAARRRQDAAADAESELQMAKQQGRDMVNEARAYRERVLSELARRREMARQQIEQLIHGRDRLLQAFERARLAAVDVMAELTPLGEPSEYVNLQPTTGPVPIMVGKQPAAPTPPTLSLVPDEVTPPDEADHTVALSLDALAGQQQRGADVDERADVAEPNQDDAPGQGVEATPSVADASPDVADAPSETVEFLDATDAAPADTTDAESDHAAGSDADEAPGEAPAEAVETVDAERADFAEHDAERDLDGGDNVVELFAGESRAAAAEPSSTESVDDLFARLRAARAEAVVRRATTEPEAAGAVAADVAPADPADAPRAAAEPVSNAADADADLATLAADVEGVEATADLVPIIVAVARKLKRVLADEQNEVLDLLRRKEPVRSVDTLVSWDSSERYAAAVEGELADAAFAGARGDANGRDVSLYRPACDAVTNDIVAPLRDRLTRAVDKADGDNTVLANQVRSVYREWKQHRIDEQVETIVRFAFDRGALTVPTA